MKAGDWVVQTRGKNGRTGSVGVIYATYQGKRYLVPLHVVQFGAHGPYRRLRETSLRRATANEIAVMEGRRKC